MQGFWVPFLSIAMAELGDKTQLAIILLSAKTKKRFQLFLGTLLGFFLVDGSAVLAGNWITSFIPLAWIKIFSGLLFIFFGIMILKNKEEETGEDASKTQNVFLLGFSAIFFAELGDKTQIASGLFAAKYSWPPVLAGAMAALALLSLLAIYAGQWLSGRFKPALIKKTSGILFIIIGCSFLLF